MATVLPFIRTIAFYLTLILWTILWAGFSTLVIGFLPLRLRHGFAVRTWNRMALWLCKIICGIRWEVIGKENIPQKPCVIVSNHQSTWETFVLQTLFSPQSQVLKKSLLSIPFFGWALALTKPIAIDRSNKRAALQQVIKDGGDRIKQGLWVLIFPEGTRCPHGKPGKFSRSGAVMACNSGADVIPVAHNAGTCWVHGEWLKRPGTIRVEIGKPISTEGKSHSEVQQESSQWILDRLSQM
ncbi:lysophospholipid acyltransferase family protein [Endozoicomonadaceae bacterium StTr2]